MEAILLGTTFCKLCRSVFFTCISSTIFQSAMKPVPCLFFYFLAALVTVSAGDYYLPPVVKLCIQMGLFSTVYVVCLLLCVLLLTDSATPWGWSSALQMELVENMSCGIWPWQFATTPTWQILTNAHIVSTFSKEVVRNTEGYKNAAALSFIYVLWFRCMV